MMKKLAVFVAILVALPLLFVPAASADVVFTRFHAYDSNPARCLDGFGEGGLMHTNLCNDGNFQKFYWNNTPGVQTPIRSAGETRRLCLQAEGTQVRLRDCRDGAIAQRWLVVYPAGGNVPFIRTVVGEQLCLNRTTPEEDEVKLGTCVSGIRFNRWFADR